MDLSLTELNVMEQVAHGKRRVSTIKSALHKSQPQIYRTTKELQRDGFITRRRGELAPTKSAFTSLFLQLLIDYPNLKNLLADSGLPILMSVLSQKTVKEIEEETHLKKSIIYQKLKEALKTSVITKQKNRYIFNDRLWGKLREFLIEYKRYQENIDSRVPVNSVIYSKTDEGIVFSNRLKLDATPTAFSAFENYGIRLLLPTNYYYLPKQKLSRTEVFIHALDVAEKEKSIQIYILVALFHLKFKKQLLRIKHPVLVHIKKVLKGQSVPDFPSKEEILDRAEVYDIRL